MDDFIPGQRWINDAQLQLGLGTVLSSDVRSVTLVFLATGDSHTYSRYSAPLTRVHFSIGDNIISHENEAITITKVTEADGLLTYIGINETGQLTEIGEPLLNNFIQLNRPIERLFNGQIDKNKWFELRQETLQHLNKRAHSKLRGLIGGRTSLISHQLYIAHEVANRYAPRILLADEVGLGKTIEAGMILHQQLVTERIQRVLIIVPESLVHQWLVEMLRRFNLLFHVFDEQRCTDILESGEAENPFQTEQLILCSQEFITQATPSFQQCRDSQWDLLVVDEAHHLQWTEEKVSHEYEVIEELALQTKGVLLLTATPEQLGKESHFARLRLLDPNRFPNFEAFKEEEKHYEPIAHAIEQLMDRQMLEQGLDSEAQTLLESYRTEGDNQQHLDTLGDETCTKKEKTNARNILIDHLLDRHGTGRVLFRNTRSAIKGFPKRELYAYPLALPTCYQGQDNTSIQHLLNPELSPDQSSGDNWVKEDPRVAWLSSFLRQQGTQKTLVIASSATTALDLAHTLLINDALHASVFHEDMSLIERDRAAAFFADQEDGSQVLICSEIGSEGRNFQFAHAMVLFDLPLNPDLLEQRIGRLDRIGQTEIIQIHTPYLTNSAQDVLFNWYHHGLQAFEHTCPAGGTIFKAVQNELMQCLREPNLNQEALDNLIQHTASLLDEQNTLLQKGRDRLLEYSSCRPQIAKSLKKQALAEDESSDRVLTRYMENMYDCYGIDSEEYRENSYLLTAGKHMLTTFPGLREGGMAVTYQRETALANEDLHYLSWDHPLVSEAMDLVATSEMGNASLIAIKHPALRAGAIMVETLHVLDTASAHAVQSQRYLPPSTIHMIINPQGKDISHVLSSEVIKQHQTKVDKKTAKQLIKMKENELRHLITQAEQQAKKQTPLIIKQAHEQAKKIIETEINRLNAQQHINPNIRPEEIEFFEQQLDAVTNAINTANMRLDAVRIIVTI